MKLRNKKHISLFLGLMLVMSMAFTTIGCGGNQENNNQPSTEAQSTEVAFVFTVVDAEGNETSFDIATDKETVGEALLEEGLIAGEESEYGLYVKTVNGITADYDTDGTYWAFYVNGEYASSGVDTTAVEEGATYSFKVEK